MSTEQEPHVDYLLISALNHDLGGAPKDWKAELPHAEFAVLSTAISVLQMARNRAVEVVHDNLAHHLGLPVPAHDGPGYVTVHRSEARPKDIVRHLSTRGKTVAGAIALGYNLRSARGDHSAALRASGGKGTLLTGGYAQLAPYAWSLMGYRPESNTLLQPGMYAIAVGYASKLPRRHADDKVALGVYSVYEQAYAATGKRRRFRRLATDALNARRAAYSDVRAKYDYVKANPVGRAAIPELQREIGEAAFFYLSVHLGDLLDRPYED